MLYWPPLQPLFRPLAFFFILFRTASPSCCSSNHYLIPIIVTCLTILCILFFLGLEMVKRRRADPELGVEMQDEEANTFSPRGARRSMSSTSTSTVVRRRSGFQPVPPVPSVPLVVERSYWTSESNSGFSLPFHPPSVPRIDTAVPITPLFPNTPLFASPVVDRDSRNHVFGPLPDEVLLEILRHAFPPPGIFSQSVDPYPFRLRQVCQRLKDIIDGTPVLWRSLRPPLNNSKCTASTTRWYRSVVTRLSGSIPSFDHVTLEFPQDEDSARWGLFQTLLPFVEKSAAVKIVGHNFPSTHATLQGIFSDTETTVRRKKSDGPEMEHLRSVEWSMPHYQFQDPLPSFLNLPWSSLRALPWHQLTSVILIMRLTLHDCAFIFGHASSIERLELGNVSVHSADVIFSEHVTHTLSRLRALAITAEVDLSTLFRKYPMPQLRELTLTLGGRDTAAELHQLAVPWQELTNVDIDCFLAVEVVENIVRNLELVDKLVFKGTLMGDGNWSVHKYLPLLRSFTLSSNNATVGSAMVTHFAHHVFPPSIKIASIPLIPSTVQQVVPHPFGSLQEVELSQPISPWDFFFFFSLVKNLQKGKFIIRDTHWDQLLASPSSPASISPAHPVPPPPNFAPTISRIADLDLALEPFEDMPHRTFLDALTFPSLVSFTFKAARSPSGHQGLVELLRRSQCHVKKLSLEYPSLGNDEVIETMELLSSSLENFTAAHDVYYGPFSEAIFQKLTHTTGSPMGCLCPRLKYFDIRPCTGANFFTDMVLSRSSSANKCTTCGKVEKLARVGAAFVEDYDPGKLRRELTELGVDHHLEVW